VDVAGWLLIAGFAIFMAGAVGWRLEFQAPLPERFVHLAAHRGRIRWIHRTMTVAMVVTPAGLFATASVAQEPLVWAAAAAYAIGALPWIGHLVFRLTVSERVAADVASGASVPDWFAPLEAWMGVGHRIHMLVAYASAVALAWGLHGTDLVPDWLAWAGGVWGALWFAASFVPRIRFAFDPPFWAHLFTFAIGVALV
jgi:hypothetical protein